MRQRPNDGDHTQHPSGTAERNTLRQLYAVISIPTMGRMAKNRKVEESAATVWLNNVCTLTVNVVASRLQVCGGKTCLWGKYHAKRP